MLLHIEFHLIGCATQSRWGLLEACVARPLPQDQKHRHSNAFGSSTGTRRAFFY
ncbi:hypothetical protein [Pontibacter pamirensis]|uniref:hypothetical protein n=1 Tax=Pontibacter pamirensis TaxID=2562824 RepID=UPI00138A4167|nr:hypothetical protein [Pontibacter pamirensis]